MKKMVKKKTKTGKKGKKEGAWLKDDVSVYTGLPPQVEGQLRCYVRLTVAQILWSIPRPPDVSHVRVKWWGETGDGAIFRPFDVKKGNKEFSRTTARYAVRAGPRQFAAYLKDMDTLLLELVASPSMQTVARANVDNIAALAPNRSIKGFFPLQSADDEKVADLQVTVAIEAIMASYDSSSSIPTPDMSVDVHSSWNSEARPVEPPRAHPLPQPKPAYSSGEDPFASPSSKKYPKPVDNKLRDPLATNFLEPSTSSSSQMTGANFTAPAAVMSNLGTAGVSFSQSTKGSDDSQPVSARLQGPTQNGHIEGDLVTELLERGKKLREAMIVATLDGPSMSKALSNQDTIPEPMKITGSPTTKKAVPGSSVLKARLEEVRSVTSSLDPAQRMALLKSADFADLDSKAIDLILGSGVGLEDDWKVMGMMGSPGSSLMGEDLSDMGDPIHDEDLLQELFYKDQESDDDVSVDLTAEETKPRRKSVDLTADHGIYDRSQVDTSVDQAALRRSISLASLEDTGNRRPPSRCSSGSSLHLDDQPVRDTDKPGTPKKQKKSGRGTPKKTKKKSKPPSPQGSPGKSKPPSSPRVTPKKSRQKANETTPNTTPKKSKKKANRSYDSEPTHHDESDLNVLRITKLSPHNKSLTEYDDMDSMMTHSSQQRPADGLTVGQLTMLGRVHAARVVIENLELSDRLDKSKSHGKPPRPTKKSCTYFVEYHFPVVTAGNRLTVGPSSMGTEVIRVASKRVEEGVVSFGHRSIFPQRFDGNVIERWWKAVVIFKVYSKTQTNKVPTLLGVCSLPLQSVLQSSTLSVDFALDVRDRSQGSRGSSPARSTSSRGGASATTTTAPLMGHIKVSIELVGDKIDAPVKPVSKSKAGPRVLDDAPTAPMGLEALKKRGADDISGLHTKPVSSNIEDLHRKKETMDQRAAHTMGYHQSGEDDYQGILSQASQSQTLHSLLMIPCCVGVGAQSTYPPHLKRSMPSALVNGWTGSHTHGDRLSHNLYLVCRMFWCEEMVMSNVCWGMQDAQFNFMQVAPMLLNKELIEHLKNNYMVVEVWDKKTSANKDELEHRLSVLLQLHLHSPLSTWLQYIAQRQLQAEARNISVLAFGAPYIRDLTLVGIVKLPLHQFFLSYRDPKLATAMLRSKYPVVATDTDWPIISPFSGATCGQLQVLLAMGTIEQIAGFQQVRCDGLMSSHHPSHRLDQQQMASARWFNSHQVTNHSVEHVFDVSVDGAQSLQLIDTMIWGEADCFVQYHFPSQETPQVLGVPSLVQAGTPTLKAFRTATTLCVPEPVFNDVTRHRLIMPEGTPVQREILTACAGVGGGGGGVQFELWCRYYYPNVRDQVIAKGLLPLAKLCGMVTMHRRGESSTQTFSLPLTSVSTDGIGQLQMDKMEVGFLNVTVNYKSQQQPAPDLGLPGSEGGPGGLVSLTVGVLRATGLQASACVLSSHYRDMQYPAEVGVNAYVRVHLSFQQKQTERLTRTVARSFAPEFSSHFDFSLPLAMADSEYNNLSLAETLEEALADFEIWHQVPLNSTELGTHYQFADPGGTGHYAGAEDVLLGKVSIPLKYLLTRKTGVRGWFPVQLTRQNWEPEETGNPSTEPHMMEQVVGGLEIVLKFGRHDDLTRLLHTARGLGWVPRCDVEETEWEEPDEEVDYHYQVSISLDRAFFPGCLATPAGKPRLENGAHCYIRYKIYDQGAVCSQQVQVYEDAEGYVDAAIQHNRSTLVKPSAPFAWYLREESLEVQLWLTRQPETSSKHHPSRRDKLIGTAYLDLSSLADRHRNQHRITGVFPLFKPGTASMGGACVQAQVTLQRCDGYINDDDQGAVLNRSLSPKRTKQRSPSRTAEATQELPVNLANTFAVNVLIDRAYHLSQVTDKQTGETTSPNAYVSYQTAESSDPSYTAVCPANPSPVWDHSHDTRLHNGLLGQQNKHLVFKVWHKSGHIGDAPDKTQDQVLGFVSVDLAPLVSGFHQVAGFYHIVDLGGHCQGQIKISVTPMETLTDGTLDPNNMSFHNPNTSAVFPPMPTVFYAHGRQPSLLDLQPTATFSRFAEHYQNVRQFHESLSHHGEAASSAAASDDNASASKSFLLTNLRTNLNELDQITQTLRQRLGVSDDAEGSTLSNPLSNTTYNLAIPQGTGSTIATTIASTAKQSSSLSATTTFLGVHDGHFSDPLPSTADPMSVRSHPSDTTSHREEVDYEQPDFLNTFSSLGSASQLTQTLSRQVSEGFSNFNNPLLSTLESTTTWNLPAGSGDDGKAVHFEAGLPEAQVSDNSARRELPSSTMEGTQELTLVTPASLKSPPTYGDRVPDHFEWPAVDGTEDVHGDFHHSDDPDDEDDGEVIVPRPLNDVSSADFYTRNQSTANFEQTMRDPLAELRTTHPDLIHQTSILSEEDSWNFPHPQDKSVETIGNVESPQRDTLQEHLEVEEPAAARLSPAHSSASYTQEWIQSASPLHGADDPELLMEDEEFTTREAAESELLQSEDVTGEKVVSRTTHGGTPQKRICEQLADREEEEYKVHFRKSRPVRHSSTDSDSDAEDHMRLKPSFRRKTKNKGKIEHVTFNNEVVIKSASVTPSVPSSEPTEEIPSPVRYLSPAAPTHQDRASESLSSEPEEVSTELSFNGNLAPTEQKHAAVEPRGENHSGKHSDEEEDPLPSNRDSDHPAGGLSARSDKSSSTLAGSDKAGGSTYSKHSSTISQHSGKLSAHSHPSASSQRSLPHSVQSKHSSHSSHDGQHSKHSSHSSHGQLSSHSSHGKLEQSQGSDSHSSRPSNASRPTSGSSRSSYTGIQRDHNNSGSSSGGAWPNFFPKAESMAQTMKTLSMKNPSQTEEPSDFSKSMTLHQQWASQGRLKDKFGGSMSASFKPQPDKAQAQRIAKIFSAKFTS